jgi:acetyltransferase-like isoleucine patch superfamily enzyme
MGFGINRLINLLSLRGIFLESKRFLKIYKYRANNLRILLGCEIINSNVGNNVFLGENVTLSHSSVGDHSYISNNSKLRNTIVGKFCSIGPNVQIILGKHPANFVSTHPAFYSNNKAFMTFADKNYIEEYEHVSIGNDVWIGEGVVIPNGVIIGDGAIITARAVVTKDVAPYSIVGGIPAKHIKDRFDIKTKELIHQSKWWNLSGGELKLHHKCFLDTTVFIEELLKMQNVKEIDNH